MSSPTPAELVDLGFARVVGLRAWAPSVGVGSFLTIEFGTPRTTSAGVAQGSFHLWVYGSTWDIRRRGDSLATSEQDRTVMIAGARILGDQRVTGYDFDPDLMRLILRFEADLELIIRALGDAEMEEWFLYLDDGTVITAGPGQNVIQESAAASTAEPEV